MYFSKKMLLIVSIAFILFSTACSKDEQLKQVSNTSLDVKSAEIELKNLKKFLSITLNVSQNVIMYDDNKNSFYIPNTIFIESYESTKNRYQEANEYKLNNPD